MARVRFAEKADAMRIAHYARHSHWHNEYGLEAGGEGTMDVLAAMAKQGKSRCCVSKCRRKAQEWSTNGVDTFLWCFEHAQDVRELRRAFSDLEWGYMRKVAERAQAVAR